MSRRVVYAALPMRLAALSSAISSDFFAMTDARHNFTSNQEPFESPKNLVDGAEERITELETLVNASGESCDYEIVTHTDPKTKEKVVKLRLKQRFPPKDSNACIRNNQRNETRSRSSIL